MHVCVYIYIYICNDHRPPIIPIPGVAIVTRGLLDAIIIIIMISIIIIQS